MVILLFLVLSIYMSYKSLYIFLLLLSVPIFTLAQKYEPLVVRAKIIDGDTLVVVGLNEVEVYSLVVPKTKRQRRRFTKLVRNVKKVYPWARLAGIQLKNYEDQLTAANNDRERRKIMKLAEKEINNQYGEDLKKLTFSQGKILIKLIDRETGNSSYSLVQELRGNFTAFFYQTFARIWGYDLKVEYDPEGKDKQIETIVKMIERGQI